MDRKPSALATGPSWRDTPAGGGPDAPQPPVVPEQQNQDSGTGPDQREQTDRESKPRSRKKAKPTAVRFPGKRKRVAGDLDPFAWRSFNCNMPVVLRRLTRVYAANNDLDIQDVVAQALVELLEREGITVPQTREEYDKMLAAGKL